VSADATAQPGLTALTAPNSLAAAEALPRARWHQLMLALATADAVSLVTAFSVAYLARFKAGLPLLETPPHTIAFYSSLAFWAVPAWLALFAIFRLYDPHELFTGSQEYLRIVNACTVGLIVIVLISFLDRQLIISRGWLLLTWLLAIATVGGGRFAVRRLVRYLRRHGRFCTTAVIVGANNEGQALADQLLADRGTGLRLAGFIDSKVGRGTPVIDGLSVIGSLGELKHAVHHLGVQEIVIATTALTREELLDLYAAFGYDETIELRLSSGLFEVLTTGVRVRETGGVSLMTPQRVRITGIDAILKATLDYVLAIGGLLVLLPLLMVLGALIKLDSPGPVLHRRRVLGVSGRPFEAFKFRTMVVDAEQRLLADEQLRQAFGQDYKLKMDPRVTRVGHVLRRTSLDELPQLFNVLRGEMSLVGPRMIAPDEAQRYGKWQLNLVTVKPGITGPWQVQGRSDLPYEQRIRLSMHYIRNYSIWLDLEILLRTIYVVLRGKGAY
jgi:exopolysaccharide biosynthesis polyprenyl glycosylphosphotransferase